MPTKTRRRGDDDEEDVAPRRKRTTSEDEDDDFDSKPKGKGWGALAKKRAEQADSDEEHIREFWLKSGESAVIQFISPEPFCLDGHMVKFDSGNKNWSFTPCQLSEQRYCLMCREKIKKTWKAAFKVLDYRGTWDKDKSKFKHDTQIEKLWLVGATTAEQIKTFIDKKGKALTDVVFEVTRSGKGKNTTYNVAVAYDEDNDDRPFKPVRFKEQFPKVDKLMKPLTDKKLEAKGFSAPDEDED